MRILYLNHNVAWSGGTFFRALPCATALAARGHDVTLLSISPKRRVRADHRQHEGVHVIETPDLFWGRGRSGWDPWDVLNRIATLHGNRHWDIVHSWDCRPVAILPALWARARSRPHSRLLTDWADWWGRGGTQGERGGGWMRAVWPLETFFEETFRAGADATTTISTALRDRVLGMGVPASKVRVVRQGCGTVAVGNRQNARSALGLPPDVPVVVYVGRLLQSDAALLYESVTELFRRRPACRFIMVGKHGTTIPAGLAVDGRFLATGVVASSALADYLAACDLSIVATADTLAGRARWPSKVNGLLAAGRVTVLTDVGDLPPLLRAAGAAVVTPPIPQAIVDGVERVLDDAGLRTATEAAASRVAAGELSWTRIAGELESFYKAV
jgi:glycosyltransferase involved in cell wall biosynthesis